MDPGIERMTSSQVCAMALEWIDDTEELRKKSKNLNFRISSTIKKNLIKIKEAVVNLTMRVESKGDSKFLSMRNTEQALRLYILEEENGRLKEQVKNTSRKTSPARKRRVGVETVTVTPDIGYFATGESSDGW